MARRNLATWRADVIALNGSACAAADSSMSECLGQIECHHLWYRSQGGPDVAENGLPLCTRHHAMVHARLFPVRPEWLLQVTIDFLADAGVVAWDEWGNPVGRHWKGFAVVASR